MTRRSNLLGVAAGVVALFAAVRFTTAGSGIALTLLGGMLHATAASAAPIDIGPAVGTVAPPLHVVNDAGVPQTVQSLSGPHGVVLVFFRSAAWCPFCMSQLMSLRAAPAELAKRGYTLAAISYDPPATQAEFAAKRDINYPLLSDKGSVTIDAFGLRDPQYKPDSMAYGVPQPAIFVIAPNGTVRAKLAEAGYKTRPPLDAVLGAIDALPR
jgi:peroxiredoxin